MADKKIKIELIISKTGDVHIKQVGKDLKNAGTEGKRSADKTTKAWDKVKAKSGGWADSAKKLQKSWLAITAVIVSLGLAFNSTIGFGGKFEKGLANVSTLVDTTKVDIDALGDSVLDMTTRVIKSSEDLNQGLYQVFSAGIEDTSEALAVLEVSARAAVAGLSDTETSVDSITTILNAYGLQAREATRVSDLMFQTVKLGKITFSQLASSIGTVISPAAAVGLKLEDLFSAIATLTKGGIDSNTAMTALRATILSVVSPSEDAIKTAKRLGLAWNTAALKSKGLVGFLNDMKKVTNGNIETMAKLIPETRALNAVLSLTGQQSGELNRILGEMEDASGATAEAFEKQTDTYDAQVDRLGIVFKNFGTNIGRLFIGPITTSLKFLSDFFGTVGDEIDELKGRIDPLTNAINHLNNASSRLPTIGGRDVLIADINKVDKVRAKLWDLGISLSSLRFRTEKEMKKISNTIAKRMGAIENIRSIPDFITPDAVAQAQKASLKIREEISKILTQLREVDQEGTISKGMSKIFQAIAKDAELQAGNIIKTWADMGDKLKENFAALDIFPQAKLDAQVGDIIKSFEAVGNELDKRGELNIDTAGKLRQKLIEKLKGLGDEAAASGFIVDDDQIKQLESLLENLGESSIASSQKVLKSIDSKTGATVLTIKKSVLDTNKFISSTAKESISAFQKIGLNMSETLVSEFSASADAHVAAWKFTTDQLKEMDISYTESFLGELDKREEAFDKYLKSIQATTGRIQRLISESLAPQTSITVSEGLHSGGVIGDAVRRHTGGMLDDPRRYPGLGPNEVPVIGLRGEGMVSRRGMSVLGRGNLDRLNRGQNITTSNDQRRYDQRQTVVKFQSDNTGELTRRTIRREVNRAVSAAQAREIF